jgi:hypothetical protein
MTTSNEISDRPQPAPSEGRWVKLGEVGVDSGVIAVCDPCCVESESDPMSIFDNAIGEGYSFDNAIGEGYSAPYGTKGLGVQFHSGFGDGLYEVWGWLTDCGRFGERVAQVVISLIDE